MHLTYNSFHWREVAFLTPVLRKGCTKREIEFLMDGNSSIVPIGVKAGRGSTASLNAVLEREDVTLGYKLIDGNVGRVGKKITIPLYMTMFLGS